MQILPQQDGTVRAYDLVRYRNFRTLTTPQPQQFLSLGVDPGGEIACAGTLDSFQVRACCNQLHIPCLLRFICC